MKNLRKINPVPSHKKDAFSIQPEGEQKKINSLKEKGMAANASVKSYVKGASNHGKSNGAAAGYDQVRKSKIANMISMILIFLLTFLFTPFYFLKKMLMIVFAPVINRLLNFLERNEKRKSKKGAGLFDRFLNLCGNWDTSHFGTNFANRKELQIPVSYKYFGRYSKFPTTTRYFVLMGVPSTGNVMIVVPLLPGTILGDIALMHIIFNAAATSSSVTFPPLFISGIQGRLTATDLAETKVKALGAGQRDEALKISYADLKQLVIYVQDAVTANPLHAFSITESCHLHLRGTGGQHPSSFHVENGALVGTVIFDAAAAGPHTAHLWWVSFDNQVTWDFVDVSIWKEMTRTGFTSGAELWFDHQVVNTSGRLALDGPKKLRIN